jgi:hypothetical protein
VTREHATLTGVVFFRCDKCRNTCGAQYMAPIHVPTAPGWLRITVKPWARWSADERGRAALDPDADREIDLCERCSELAWWSLVP